MFRRENYVRCTKEGVRPGCVYGDPVTRSIYLKIDFRAFTFSDPVSLHLLERLGPIEQVEILKESLGVGGNLEHPLAHRTPFHQVVSAFGAGTFGSIENFFVG